MLDYLYEMKTSRRNRTLDSQRFSVEEVDNILDPIKSHKASLLARKTITKPIEMESVHIDIQKKNCKKGLLGFLKKK